MRVPDAIRDCAVYVYTKTPPGDEAEPYGTAFFVSVPSETLRAAPHVYLVTAKHLLDKGKVFLRYNNKSDKAAEPVELPHASQWYALDDKGVDIAALLLDESREWFEDVAYEPIPHAVLCTDGVVEENYIGVGDELLVTGLLINHPGHDRNIPIVRAGIISAMPRDQLRDQYKDRSWSYPYTAYLAELRSTGGLSGSPVFVVIGGARMANFQSNSTWDDVGIGVGTMGFRLLGLIRGHWANPPEQGHETSKNAMFDSESEGINRGIAKVVPAQFLEELLMTGKPRSDRQERDEKRPRGGD